MKKQKFPLNKVLTLGKRTITNLNESEMNLQGGQWTVGCSGRICNGGGKSKGCTNAHTCIYTCV